MLLKEALGNLQGLIRRDQAAPACLQEKEKVDLASEKAGLEGLLMGYLLEHELTSRVRGVGPVLAERLGRQAFLGRLSYLHRASPVLSGIGPAKQAAILAWARQVKANRFILLAGIFPANRMPLRSISRRRRR